MSTLIAGGSTLGLTAYPLRWPWWALCFVMVYLWCRLYQACMDEALAVSVCLAMLFVSLLITVGLARQGWQAWRDTRHHALHFCADTCAWSVRIHAHEPDRQSQAIQNIPVHWPQVLWASGDLFLLKSKVAPSLESQPGDGSKYLRHWPVRTLCFWVSLKAAYPHGHCLRTLLNLPMGHLRMPRRELF